MATLKYKRPNYYATHGLLIRPGDNEIDDAKIKVMMATKAFRKRIEQGLIEIVQDAPALPESGQADLGENLDNDKLEIGDDLEKLPYEDLVELANGDKRYNRVRAAIEYMKKLETGA